jgi:hypothetical protein
MDMSVLLQIALVTETQQERKNTKSVHVSKFYIG